MNDETYYDEGTLTKVYEALASVDISNDQATEAVDAMQNHGILFRERLAADVAIAALRPVIETDEQLDALPDE